MASLHVFHQMGEKEVRFEWTRASLHTVRTECPLIGEVVRVLPGQLHRGCAVTVVAPSGASRTMHVVELLFNDLCFDKPLLLLSKDSCHSEYSLAVLLPGCNYSSLGVMKKTWFPWFSDQGEEQLSGSSTRQHIFCTADTTRDVVLPEMLAPTAQSSSSNLSSSDIQQAITRAAAAGRMFQHAIGNTRRNIAGPQAEGAAETMLADNTASYSAGSMVDGATAGAFQ